MLGLPERESFRPSTKLHGRDSKLMLAFFSALQLDRLSLDRNGRLVDDPISWRNDVLRSNRRRIRSHGRYVRYRREEPRSRRPDAFRLFLFRLLREIHPPLSRLCPRMDAVVQPRRLSPY